MPVAPATLRSGSRIPFLRTLGVSLREIGDDHAVMQVRVGRRHANYFGGVHGGLIATLVDTVSFFPRPLLPSGRAVTTTNLAVTYVRAPRIGEVLTARSRLLHLGRRTASVVANVEDADGRLLAHGAVTLLVLDADGTGAAGGEDAPAGSRAAARTTARRRPAGARRRRAARA